MGISPFGNSFNSLEKISKNMLVRNSFGSIKIKKDKIIVKDNPLPNPNPDNYSIIKYQEIKNKLLIKIKYHDCTNYEGEKILIFNCSYDDIIKQKLIDPHFCEDKSFYSPIARFEPTDDGWELAIKFIETCF
jgi:hypothetical protein